MKKMPTGNTRKRALVAAVVCLSCLAIGGVMARARSLRAAGDKANLQQQRTAMGMPDPGQMRARMLTEMAANLGLTETQKGRLKAAMEEGPDFGSIFADRSLSSQQRFERLRQAGRERDARVRSILTPEQQVKYEQMQQQRREQMRERFRSRRGPGGSGRSAPIPG